MFNSSFLKSAIQTVIYIYQNSFGLVLGGACRFEPSCSQYCIECFENHDVGNATFLSLKRLSKCRPFGGFGYDPVPKFSQADRGIIYAEK